MIRLRRGVAAVAERERPPEHEDPRPEQGADEQHGTGDREGFGGRGSFGRSWPWAQQTPINVKLIYAGLLMSLALPPVAIIAVIFAHYGRQAQPNSWLATHYTYQIRTFWIGLCANLCAYALSFVGIGLLLYVLIAVWVVARSVHGIAAIAQRKPLSDPYAVIV